MTFPMPTTAGAPDRQCIACGIDQACSAHAISLDQGRNVPGIRACGVARGPRAIS